MTYGSGTRRGLAALFVLAILVGCETTNREPAIAVLVAEGTAPSTITAGAYQITLVRADVAFGPLFLCATRASSADLCETAVLETREAHVFDALDPAPRELALLEGVTGRFRTAQYDHGVAFPLGATSPAPLPMVEHSAIVEGTVTDGVDAFDFELSLDVTASVSGQTTVVGRTIEGDVPASGGRLTVRFDAAALVRDVPWASVSAMPRPPSGPVVIAEGTLAYDVASQALVVNHPVVLSYAVEARP